MVTGSTNAPLGIALIAAGLFSGLWWLLREANVTNKYLVPILLAYPLLATPICRGLSWWMTMPAITKTIIVSVVNSSADWMGASKDDKINLSTKMLFFPIGKLPILRSQFVPDKTYPLDLEITHQGRQVYITGAYFTLRFPKTVTVQFSEDQRDWRQEKSTKEGYATWKTGVSMIFRGDHKKIWPTPRLRFPGLGRYDFEYVLDASGQDYNEHAFDVGVLTGKFLIEVHE